MHQRDTKAIVGAASCDALGTGRQVGFCRDMLRAERPGDATEGMADLRVPRPDQGLDGPRSSDRGLFTRKIPHIYRKQPIFYINNPHYIKYHKGGTK